MRLPGLLFVAVCLAVAVAGARAVLRPGAEAVGELRRREAVESRLRAFRRMEERKGEVAAEVIEGRLGLREAGREFGRMNAALDDGFDDVLGPPVVPRGEEALCRNVILWVGVVLRDHPGRAGPTLRRLEDEFRREFPAGQTRSR